MLIKLLAPTHPTVLFAITYQNLPDELYNPLAWTSILGRLSADSLEPPKFIHALDKASWIPSVLEEITFNMTSLTVSCVFVDGSSEEWPLSAHTCLRALDSVLSDVSMSTVDVEKERERQRERERQIQLDRLKQEQARKQQSLNSPPATFKITGKHKKNRSLLMTFVSNFVSLPSQHDGPASAPITRVPSPSPVEIVVPVQPQPDVPPVAKLTAKALRRRARSTLVDTFRIHVLAELKTRLPVGGYYTWIIHSMLRRGSDTMAEIISQSASFNADYTVSPFDDENYFPPPALLPSRLEHDEDTDTDDSSVHTPSTSHFASPNFSYPSKSISVYGGTRHVRDLSSDDLYEYNALSAMCTRLRHLLAHGESQKALLENDIKQTEDVLEVRSRRRAWQNKSLVVGGNVGLATPYTSSRLSQAVWTADDFEYAPSVEDHGEEQIEEYEYDKVAYGSRRMKGKGDLKLFPVSEEDDEEDGDPFDAREYELELGFDEGLRSWRIDDDDEEEVELEGMPAMALERPRANSIQQCTPAKTAASLLCQSLPPSYAEVDVAGINVTLAGYSRFAVDSEFTLSMDASPFKSKKALPVSSEPDTDWLEPSHFSAEVV